MARENYLEFIQDAKELIEEFGQDCWWQKAPLPTVGGVPGYPVAAPPSQPLPCTIAFFSAKDLDRGVLQVMDVMPGTEVGDSQQVGLMAGGLAFEPETTDTIRRGAADAAEISIIKMDVLAPNGTPVLYFVTVAA
jgi:hypothetical protein